MATPRGSSGGITEEKFYQAQIELKQSISELQLRLVSEIGNLKSALPSCDDVDAAKKLAKEALDRANDVDRKTNWFSGITAMIVATAAALNIWFGGCK